MKFLFYSLQQNKILRIYLVVVDSNDNKIHFEPELLSISRKGNNYGLVMVDLQGKPDTPFSRPQFGNFYSLE